MSGQSAAGFAAWESRRARRALWIFLAVAVVCVAQVSWWIIYQVRQADGIAELRKAQLDLRSLQIAVGLNDQVSALWDEFNELVKDTTWRGAMPRRLLEHPLVLAHNRFPPVTRRVQSPFGQYDMDNWTWIFQGAHDTLWITLDPTAVARLVELADPGFEFRGEAPFPGALPYPLDPVPVRPKAELLEQVDRDRHGVLVMFGSEGSFFLLLTVVGVYLIYRTVLRSAELARRQRNFVAAVTHELKAPLASVKLYSETLLRPEIQPSQQREFLERMLQDTSRLEHLIDNVLLAGRLEEKGFHLELKPGDLSVAVAEYERGLRGYLERHHFTLTSNLEPGLHAVFDYDALRRVVEGLVDNAVKYAGESRRGELTLAREGELGLLTLRDEGVGIPADQLDKVFGAFYRVGDEMTRQIRGTGLGLFLVREIVSAHGGDVKLESGGPGRGTTVKITLRLSS